MAALSSPPRATAQGQHGDRGDQAGGGVADFALANGIEVLIERVPGAKHAGLFCFIKQGFSEDPPGRVGLAHFVEHLVMTARTDEREGWDALRWSRERRVANAMTRPRYTVYFSVGERAQISADARRFADVLRGKLEISQELVDRERGRLLIEIANMTEQRPGAALQWRARALALEGSPEARVGIGLRQDVAKLDIASLRRAIQRTHRPEQCLLVLCGDVDPAVDRPFLEQVFASIEAEPMAEPVAGEASDTKLKDAVAPHPRAGAPFAVLAYRAPAFGDADFPAFCLAAFWLGQRANMAFRPRGREVEAGLWPALYAILDEPRVAYFGRRGTQGQSDEVALREELRAFIDASRAAAKVRVVAAALPSLKRQYEQLLLPRVDMVAVEAAVHNAEQGSPEASSAAARLRAQAALLRIAASPEGMYRTGLARGVERILGFPKDLMQRLEATTAGDVVRVLDQRFAFERAAFAAALPMPSDTGEAIKHGEAQKNGDEASRTGK